MELIVLEQCRAENSHTNYTRTMLKSTYKHRIDIKP